MCLYMHIFHARTISWNVKIMRMDNFPKEVVSKIFKFFFKTICPNKEKWKLSNSNFQAIFLSNTPRSFFCYSLSLYCTFFPIAEVFTKLRNFEFELQKY